jgi:hypothetical protein
MRHARSPRRIAVAAVAVVGVLAGGSWLRRDDGPGDAVRVDGVSYEVTRVAVLEPAAANDRALLAGAGTHTAPGLEWLGVFVKARNTAGAPRPAAGSFAIVDDAGRAFRPVRPAGANVYAYRAAALKPGGTIPAPASPAAYSPEQGSVLLFEVPPADTELELRLYDPARPSRFAVVRLSSKAHPPGGASRSASPH